MEIGINTLLPRISWTKTVIIHEVLKEMETTRKLYLNNKEVVVVYGILIKEFRGVSKMEHSKNIMK